MTGKRKTPENLRSARWMAPDDFRSFGHRSRAMQMGFGPPIQGFGKARLQLKGTGECLNGARSIVFNQPQPL